MDWYFNWDFLYLEEKDKALSLERQTMNWQVENKFDLRFRALLVLGLEHEHGLVPSFRQYRVVGHAPSLDKACQLEPFLGLANKRLIFSIQISLSYGLEIYPQQSKCILTFT